jgi:predicted nucleic-acid-binding protein
MLEQYPFNESEIVEVENEFDLQNELNKVNKQQKILEAISGLKKRKNTYIEIINGFPGTFPKIRRQYTDRIEKIIETINTLIERYNKIN